VRISKCGRAGLQETLSYIQPGNFFGEMALIDGQPRSAKATAAEPAVLGCISAESFARMLELAPSHLHMNFLRSVVEHLRGIDSHFITEVMRTERLSMVGTMANSIIHDLKTPIQALISCTSCIAERVQDPQIKQFIGMMEKANTMMVDMVQELLDFARGQSSLHLARHPAQALIEELDAQLFRIVPPNVHLFREIQCCDEIKVDTGRLARVLLNLIKNAIEAMPQGGVLFLAMKKENGRVTIRVSDTGCGIPAELQSKIFEPFVTHGKSKGTGLGMAIAKSVVEAHEGTISLKSAAGRGTTIEIALPVLHPVQFAA
jgi:signal transduction histidine kinase